MSVAGGVLSAVSTSRAAPRLRLGVPIFLASDDPAALAHEHRRFGYRAAYVPPVATHDTARIAAIVRAFAAEDVVIKQNRRTSPIARPWPTRSEPSPA
jgi:hypothetical protein